MRTLRCAEVREKWHEFNVGIFAGLLRPTKFYITSNCDSPDEGWIWKRGHSARVGGIGLNCHYLTSSHWSSVLLHEMVHQFQWEVGESSDDWVAHAEFPAWHKYITDLGYEEQIL